MQVEKHQFKEENPHKTQVTSLICFSETRQTNFGGKLFFSAVLKADADVSAISKFSVGTNICTYIPLDQNGKVKNTKINVTRQYNKF